MGIFSSIHKNRGLIIALAVSLATVLIYSSALKAHASTVYYQPYTGEPVTVFTASGLSDSTYVYTPNYTIDPQSYPISQTYTINIPGSFNKIRTKWAGGTSCSKTEATLQGYDGNYALTTGSGATTTQGDNIYCDYVFSQTYGATTTFVGVVMDPNFSPPTPIPELLFDGSGLNSGASYYGDNTQAQLGGIAFEICLDTCDNFFTESSNTNTRIISLSPANNATVTSPVNFALHAYINPDDLTTIKGIRITLHNIDQNVLLLGDFSPSDIYLFEGNATTSGDFLFNQTVPLGDGNYRIEACLERTYFFGWVLNPFAPLSDCQNHQFIVGTSTFIGGISQTMFGQTNDFFEGLTATSSEALASTCNPLTNFDIRQCSAYLFIPDGAGLKNTMDQARQGILSRVPWGYLSRMVSIFQNSATSSLPAFTATLRTGPGSDMTPDETSITIDIGDMIAGGGALLDSIEDPIHGKTARDIFEPIVKLGISIIVLFTIAMDLMGSHKHADGDSRQKTKLS